MDRRPAYRRSSRNTPLQKSVPRGSVRSIAHVQALWLERNRHKDWRRPRDALDKNRRGLYRRGLPGESHAFRQTARPQPYDLETAALFYSNLLYRRYDWNDPTR